MLSPTPSIIAQKITAFSIITLKITTFRMTKNLTLNKVPRVITTLSTTIKSNTQHDIIQIIMTLNVEYNRRGSTVNRVLDGSTYPC